MKYSNTIPVKAFSMSPYAYFNVGVRETSKEELEALLNEAEELSDEFMVEHKYCYEQIKMPLGKVSYSAIVDGIISNHYPNDKMQAIINNYLLDPEDSEAVAEFVEMQEYRKMAKQFAKELIGQPEETSENR